MLSVVAHCLVIVLKIIAAIPFSQVNHVVLKFVSNLHSASVIPFCFLTTSPSSHIVGPEYGTTETAWKTVLNETDRRCELHLRVKDNLVNDVIQSIKNWQKDNYHKQLMQIKERKELDDQFKRAQKPWVKLLEKVEKAKSGYHIACKNEKSAVNQERNATKDSSLSQDSVRSLYICLLYALSCPVQSAVWCKT